VLPLLLAAVVVGAARLDASIISLLLLLT